MKIKKDELLKALKIAQMYTAPAANFDILQHVLIDGPAGKIVATDLESAATISIAISDAIRTVETETPVLVFEDENLLADLLSMKKSELDSLAEYAGVDTAGMKKKNDVAGAIHMASKASYEKELAENPPSTVEVGEKFCVKPGELIAIINSLDGKKDDVIDLSVDEFSYAEGLLDTVHACTLSIGEHFQKLVLRPADDFPEIPEKIATMAFTSIAGNILESVACVTDAKNEKPVAQMILFDSVKDRGNIVGCDIKRLHMLKHPMTETEKAVPIPCKPIQSACKLAKTEIIRFSVNPGPDIAQVCIAFGGNVEVLTQVMNDGYPEYTQVFPENPVFQVVLDREKMKRAVEQASLIMDENQGVVLSFNGGMNVNSSGVKGEYRHENVPFEKGKVDPGFTSMFNPKFMKDILTHLGEKVKMGVQGKDQPLFFYKEKSLSGCIMPMKL